MKLTTEQISFYNENGYLIINDYFNNREVELLKSEMPKTVDVNSPRIIKEDNGEIRSIFAPHFVNDTYSALARHKKLVEPSQQLLENNVYLHQFKINSKKGLKGDWWEWHQDFPYWHIDDGIPKPDMISAMVYLHDIDHVNGPLLLIPKSHKVGIAEFAPKDEKGFEKNLASNEQAEAEFLSSLSSNIKFTVHEEMIRSTAKTNGIVPAIGSKGTVLFFHGNIFHASNVNLSPFDRDVVIITYNSVMNLPPKVEKPRPDYLAGKDYSPIICHEASLAE